MANKRSGFLQRQAEKQEDFSIKIQMITRQYMVDTLQITLHKEFGWGYDRLMELTEKWEKNRAAYHAALDPRDSESDVKQEHMQRVFDEICKKHGSVPFCERYPYLKEVRY